MTSESTLRVVPLGGLGEIGMNCMALDVGGEILVVDCGVTFPRTDLGIDTYHPDFSWLEQRKERVRGLVITHGHEDHIGAVPYFADRFEVPIYAPPYALELIKLRLSEHGFRPGDVDLRPTTPRSRFAVNGFEVEPVRVTHTIADATALAIRTREGLILHTGDFKLDPSPIDGLLTDEERLRELGDEGIRLLLSDSTNVDSHGWSSSESLASEKLLEVVGSASGRVIVGMFASNVQRMRILGDLAMKTGRRLVLLGRSVQTHSRIARDRGHLSWPSDLIAPGDQANAMKRRETLVIATGTQAERMAALWRLAHRAHPQLTLDAGDRVIFSSRIIPGNEPAVTTMVNGFLRQGVDVRTSTTDPGIHASGHAYRDEQAKMIDLTRPKSFVPVHGSLHHLHRHAKLAKDLGVEEVLVLENGEIGELAVEDPLSKSRDTAHVRKVPTWNGEPIPEQVLVEREAIARAGIAFVTVLVDDAGRPVGPTVVSTRGVLDETKDASILREAAREAHKALETRPQTRVRPTDEEIADVARLAARKRLEQAVGKKPITVTNVVRVKA